MKVVQLLKRVGGLCNLQFLHFSSTEHGYYYARRAPPRYFDPRLLLRGGFVSPTTHRHVNKPSSVLATTRTSLLPQTVRKFSDIIYDSPQESSVPPGGNNKRNLSDDNLWEAYYDSMLAIICEFPAEKIPKQVKPDDFIAVQHFLLSKKTYSQSPLNVNADDFRGAEKNLREVLHERKGSFLSQTKFTRHQYDLAMRFIVNLASNCAKVQTAKPLVTAWSKVKDSGMSLKPNFLSTFLYCFLEEADFSNLSLEIATIHDLLYGSTENSIFLRIRALIAMEDPKGAETLLNELPDDRDECKRLRTFSPILKYYCEAGDIYSVLRVWQQMRAAPGVYLDSETYALFLGTLAKSHVLTPQATPIAGFQEIGLSHACGPRLFDEIMAYVEEDLVDISAEAAVTLFNDFHAAFNQPTSMLTPTKEVPQCGIDIGVRETGGVGLLIGRVKIDNSTARCPISGASLRLLTLDRDQRQHVRMTLLKMAASQQELYGKSKKRLQADDELQKFADWLETREGEPFTAFVDGANVAYFGQGNVRYSQVMHVVKELERMGERPLVIMPRKYVNSSFKLGDGVVQQLTQEALGVVTRLVNEEKMYIVPAQCLDDYYWMLASVSDQNGRPPSVPPLDKDRFPGLRPLLISNDQMRDHKLELLEPRLFRRWYSSHVVTYTISNFNESEWEDREVRFKPADFFSCEIQGNPVEKLGMTGTAWHFPVKEWGPRAERLLVSIVALSSDRDEL